VRPITKKQWLRDMDGIRSFYVRSEKKSSMGILASWFRNLRSPLGGSWITREIRDSGT